MCTPRPWRPPAHSRRTPQWGADGTGHWRLATPRAVLSLCHRRVASCRHLRKPIAPGRALLQAANHHSATALSVSPSHRSLAPPHLWHPDASAGLCDPAWHPPCVGTPTSRRASRQQRRSAAGCPPPQQTPSTPGTRLASRGSDSSGQRRPSGARPRRGLGSSYILGVHCASQPEMPCTEQPRENASVASAARYRGRHRHARKPRRGRCGASMLRWSSAAGLGELRSLQTASWPTNLLFAASPDKQPVPRFESSLQAVLSLERKTR